MNPETIHSISKLLLVSGLVCGIIGAGYLAYDLWSGKMLRIHLLKTQLRNAELTREELIQSWQSLAERLHLKEQLSVHVTDTQANFDKIRAGILQEIAAYEDQYHDKLWVALSKGFRLIVIAFLLQLVGTLLS